MSARSKGFKSEQYHCPFRFKCGCYVALSVKYFPDRVILLQAGEHDLNRHAVKKRGLSVEQRGVVKRVHRCQWKGKFMTACWIAVPASIFRTTGVHKELWVDWCVKLAEMSRPSAVLALAWSRRGRQRGKHESPCRLNQPVQVYRTPQ